MWKVRAGLAINIIRRIQYLRSILFNMLQKIILHILIILPLGTLFAQTPKSIKDAPITKQKIIFYKLTNPNKTVKLKQGERVDIYYGDSSSSNNISGITGKIYAKSDSILFIYAVWDVYEKPISGNVKSGQVFMYPPNFSYPHDSIIGINFKKISYLRPDKYGTGGGLCILTSIASALIIGPLVSIDYSTRKFDSERYREILFPSIGLLAAGFLWGWFSANHWGYYLTVTPQQ